MARILTPNPLVVDPFQYPTGISIEASPYYVFRYNYLVEIQAFSQGSVTFVDGEELGYVVTHKHSYYIEWKYDGSGDISLIFNATPKNDQNTVFETDDPVGVDSVTIDPPQNEDTVFNEIVNCEDTGIEPEDACWRTDQKLLGIVYALGAEDDGAYKVNDLGFVGGAYNNRILFDHTFLGRDEFSTIGPTLPPEGTMVIRGVENKITPLARRVNKNFVAATTEPEKDRYPNFFPAHVENDGGFPLDGTYPIQVDVLVFAEPKDDEETS